MSPYPIDNLWRRGGHYVARLTGPDPKWGIGRDFLQGKGIKSRGILEYQPADIGDLPAWIIRATGQCCNACGQTMKTVELIAAMPHGWELTGGGYTTKDLIAIWETGLPGSDPVEQVRSALDERVEVFTGTGDTDPF